MKIAVRLTCIFLLGLSVSCTFLSARQGNEAQPQTPSNATSRTTTVPKSSGERGTTAEAKAMLQQAVAHYQEVGRKQALADFTGKKPPFVDRDLYVACIGPDHIIVANGGFPSLVGTSTDGWLDADGKSLGKASWEAASKGEGSVEYRWYNPVFHKLEPKVFFVQKVGDDLCGVGAYNVHEK